MKKSICTIGFILLGSLVFASTTQQGIVKTKGRLNEDQTITKGTPLSDAYVTVQGAQTVSSNKKGLFSLALTSKDYYLKDVNKEGYVLCDADILSRAYAYSPNPLYIVMETPAQQMEDKIFAERKLRRTLQRQLQQREDEIDTLKSRQQISEEEYRQQLQQLYSDQKENERLIAEMAERYASIDYDQLDEFNRQISALILEGKFTEADSLIRTKGDIASRIESLKEHQEKNQQEEQAIKKRLKALEKSKAYEQKELEDITRDCYSLYEIFKMQHKNDSAAYYLELRASLDTMNVDWLSECATFISGYLALYDKALEYENRAMQLWKDFSRGDSMRLAAINLNLASIYYHKHDFDKSIDYYQRGIAILSQDSSSLSDLLFTAYNNLGEELIEIYQFEKAHSYIQKVLNGSSNIETLVSAYCNMGTLYIYYFKDPYTALKILQEGYSLFLANPKNFCNFDNTKAKILMLIANAYSSANEYDNAADCYNQALQLFNSIYNTPHPIKATCYLSLGKLYYSKKDYIKSIEFCQKALEIEKHVYGTNDLSIFVVYTMIGMSLQELKEYENAISYYEQAVSIIISIYGADDMHVAVSYTTLGLCNFLKNDFKEAINFYKKAEDIYTKTLGNGHQYTATVQKSIGDTYKEIGEYELAFAYYKKAYDSFLNLYGEEHTISLKLRKCLNETKMRHK